MGGRFRLSYMDQQKLQDNQTLVDAFTKSQDLLSSNYANNHGVIKTTVETFMELEEEKGRRISREEIRKISAYLNILDGIRVLDCFDKDELERKIWNRFYKGNKGVKY